MAIQKQSFTVAAANLTGHASNVTGASWAITTTSAGDGMSHFVTIRNDSATDHSGKTITLSGTCANGLAVTEDLAGPAGSATVTSTRSYESLTAIATSATIGTDTFDIGWTAAARSPWYYVRNLAAVAVSVGGTINFDIQHKYDEAVTNAIAFTAEAAKTVDTEHVYTTPIRAARVDVNSHTAGTFTVYVVD